VPTEEALVSPDPKLEIPALTSPPPSETAKPVILLVDDEAMVRNFLEIGLRQRGYEVRLAPNGQAALDLYRAEPTAITLVILDVRMPVLDGCRTLEALRQVNPHVRCCVITGYSGGYTVKDLTDRGAACVLEKPFTMNKLGQVLESLLNAPACG
jgi:DNA-binding NtrC family response regulator